MAKIALDQLQGAMEWVSTDILDNEAYVCRQTGKIYWISGDPGVLDEEDIPANIADGDRYIPVPDKRDLGLGSRLAIEFISVHLPERYDDVRDMFRRRGAYRRFRNFLDHKGLTEAWYGYRDEHEAKALAAWCEAEDFELGS